ncbi:MAG: AmmeMemoRadiSam system protein B [Anaerolineales bacterium]
MLYPRLRALDIRPHRQDGHRYFLLRDPLQLSEQMLLVPAPLGAALALCDGTHDVATMRSLLTARFGAHFENGVVDELLTALDGALFLENDRYRAAQAGAVAAFRAAPFRPMNCAGSVYPADPAELRRVLDGYLAQTDGRTGDANIRGLLSPHIDYARGGQVYAQTWQRAAAAARAADLVVIFGTDHHSDSAGSLTLSPQNYATPFGVLPTAQGIVDSLAEAIGPDAFAGELRHRGEHSLELVAVWLHHMRGGQPVEIVPILTGSFAEYIEREVSPLTDPTLQVLIETLKRETAGRRTLVVSSGDLAHIGPAFEGEPLDVQGKARIKADDDLLVDRLCAGDAEGFYNALARVHNANNVCGLSPTYLALQLLGATEGEQVGYDSCPADEDNTSVVSVVGIVFE